MIGFNPLPDISLGDMEAVMDLGNELNLFKTNSDVSREKEKVSHIDTDRIMQTFSIPRPTFLVSATEPGIQNA